MARSPSVHGDAVLSVDKGRMRHLRLVLAPAALLASVTGLSDARAQAPGVAQPALEDTQRAANEETAAATLRNLHAGQVHCQASGVVDDNSDGVGEFAYLAELAGAVSIRSNPGIKIAQPVLSAAMGRVASSMVVRQGYCFVVFLPGAGGEPVAEAPSGGGPARGGVDALLAAEHWCAYAWPERAGTTGQRAFFIDDKGELLACDNATAKYSGTSRRPAPLAAYPMGARSMAIAREAAQPTDDGETWAVHAKPEPQRVAEEPADHRRQPSLLGEPMRAPASPQGEDGVYSTLRNLAAAQAQCQAAGVIDEDGDGAGEYGYFAELAGTSPVRGSTAAINPPVLPVSCGTVKQSVVVRDGYCFQIYLPGAAGVPVAEAATGGAPEAKLDPRRATVLWCCYAWPLEFGKTGRRAFFIDQNGDVLAMENEAQCYSGFAKRPDALAAFAPKAKTIDDPPAHDEPARDGGIWAPPYGARPR